MYQHFDYDPRFERRDLGIDLSKDYLESAGYLVLEKSEMKAAVTEMMDMLNFQFAGIELLDRLIYVGEQCGVDMSAFYEEKKKQEKDRKERDE